MVGNCNFHTIGSGSPRMTKFETIVIQATASIDASVLIHFALMKGFHAPLIGLQAKIIERTLAIVKATTKTPIPQMMAWNSRLGNIRRYRRRMDILVAPRETR